MKAQRLRFRYRVTSEGCALSQRELINAWVQALTDAALPLAYSEGKRKTPRVSIAAPLPQNVTSDWELVEVYLTEVVPPHAALKAVAAHLPPGIEAISVEEVGVQAPSLQSQLRWAEYEVELPPEVDEQQLRQAVEGLLAANSVPAEYRRETRVRQYDLRPLVLGLWLEGQRNGHQVLAMRLRAEQEMTARADQVVLALGLPPALRIHRRRLYLDEVQPAILAYRRANEVED